MYKMCIQRSCYCTRIRNFPYFCKTILMLQEERCVQMCIHRSCYCTRIRNFPYLSKIILMLQEERCIQNVYTPFLLLYENKKFAIFVCHTHVARGTVYTKCVYTVPVAAREQEIFHFCLKSCSCCNRNGRYKMCIHRSCYCTRTRNLPYLSKIILMLQEERCLQNLYTPFLLLYENKKFPYFSKIILMLQEERCVQNVYTPFLLLYENKKFAIFV